MLFIAHAGHWALGALEAAPVAIVLGVVAWKTWSNRRTAATECATPS